MRIRLIPVRYSFLAQEHTGPWNGPLRYMQAGAEQMLANRGLTVTVEPVQLEASYPDRFQACAEINKKLAQAVGQALAAGDFPLVLGGTCDLCLGILSGFDHAQSGIVWCDAHGDYNIPETSPSGEFVGMPLAIATGHCYQDLWAQVGNSSPIPDSRVLMVDVRDLDPPERISVAHAAIPVVPVSALQEAAPHTEASATLESFAARVPNVYLHLDIDVIDPQEAPGVNFPAPGGPSVATMEQAIRTLSKRFHIQMAAMTAFDPDADQDNKTLQAGLRLLAQLAESIRQPAPPWRLKSRQGA
ncbi:MAG TPA: arginase family protein [Ktedonobacterales bacterium]|nr:arginase family protein [Ktedonobacterales bacterium]